MANRNFILAVCASSLSLASPTYATPMIPDPETPPVSVQFSTTYFSNVAGTSTAFATARGLSASDVLYAPALNLNLVEPVEGLSFFLAGQGSYDIHQRDTILDRERINLEAGAYGQVSVCDTTLSGNYVRYQSDLADLSLIVTQNTQELITGELDATCHTSGRLTPSVSVSHTVSDNSALVYHSQDYDSTGVNASLAYQAGSLGTISLIGQYTRTEYPNRIITSSSGISTDGYNLYSGGLRYLKNFGANIDFSASVSETQLTTDNGSSNFNGINYDVALTYRVTPRLSLTATASNATLPSFYLNAAYSKVQAESIALNYKISARLNAALNAAQTHSGYQGAALVSGVDLTSQTLTGFSGSLSYTLSPTFHITLSGGEQHRHADLVGYSYSGAQVGLSLSKSF